MTTALRSRKTSHKPGPLVSSKTIRLAMIGMTPGNGHPYSWSAMFNGYNPEEMAKCPYPVIPIYLNKQPKNGFRIPNTQVTHIWTDDPADAKSVSKSSLIPHIVKRPEDVIGHVDAVVVASDNDHVGRCRPFIEAGLPLLVDKPMVDHEEELQTFMTWVKEGHPILSSSCMRYGKEYMPYRTSTADLGDLRFVSVTTPKSWERYGIHALEAIYPILGPGFLSVRNTGTKDRNVVHLKHSRGVDAMVVAIADLGAFGALQLMGTSGHVSVSFSDTFFAFKSQLEAFIQYLRTGVRPFPFEETVELMRLMLGAIRSREQNGREITL